MSKLMDALLAYKGPWLFWSCPNGCSGYVTWKKVDGKHIAKCESCGETSPPLVPHGLPRPTNQPNKRKGEK